MEDKVTVVRRVDCVHRPINPTGVLREASTWWGVKFLRRVWNE